MDFGFNLQSVDLQGDANPTEKQLQPLPENANINQEETHGATRSMASLKMVGMEKKSNIASLVGIQVRPSSGELATGGSEVEEDSLTQLMYEEIAEDELVSELEGHAKVTEEETDKLQESGNSWPPDLPSFRQSLRKEIQAHRKNPPDAHGEHQHSILIAPPSRKTILKAAEFRGETGNMYHRLLTPLCSMLQNLLYYMHVHVATNNMQTQYYMYNVGR